MNKYQDLQIVKATLKDDFKLEISDLQPIVSPGYVNEVYSGMLGSQPVIIRIARERNAFPYEIWGYQEFERQGIPVPKVLQYLENPPTLGIATMVMTKVPGIILANAKLSDQQNEAIFTKMGDILRRVHQIEIDGFGYLVPDGDAFKGMRPTWREHLESLNDFYGLEVLVENQLISEREYKKLNQLFEEVKDLKISQSVFLYNDLHSEHVFVEEGQIMGVIDLGNANSGDRRIDIANSLFFLSGKNRQFFEEGYGELAKDVVVDKYLALISASKARYRFRMGKEDGQLKAIDKMRETLAKL